MTDRITTAIKTAFGPRCSTIEAGCATCEAWAEYDMLKPTEEMIENGKTPEGGWTKEQLAKWGVSWPPPKGWKEALLERGK